MGFDRRRLLKFRSDYDVKLLRGEGVLLLSEQGHVHLSGAVYESLAPLLIGRYTEEQLVLLLKKKATLAELYYALEVLKKKGCIIETDSHVSNNNTIFWNSLGIDSRRAVEKSSKACASLRVFGGVDQKELISALRSVGIRIRSAGLPVVLTDDYLRNQIDAWNRKMLRAETAWMLVKPVGRTIWLGPIFVPYKTGCWECLSSRLRGHREVEEFVQRRRRTALAIPKPSLPSTRSVAANLAATEILRWLVEERNDRLEGKIVTLDMLTLELSCHVLIRRPQCKTCGDPGYENKKAEPIVLRCSPVYRNETHLHRSVSSEETIRKYQEQISPITGVISKLVRVTPQDSPVHVYFAGHNTAMKSQKLYMLGQGLRNKSSGKGKTDLIAKASAMGEAIERYSGNFVGDEIKIRATFQEIRSKAIHPELLMLYSKNQYEDRKAWNARNSAFQFIPEPFNPKARIDWIPVWSLTHSKFKYVPAGFCYYGHPQKPKETFFLADSNGNASGNTIEEAILHGFLELVERDSVAIWWYNRIKRPGVDLTSFKEPYYEELKRFYNSIHREFWVLDLTTDLSIPSFVAITKKMNSKAEEIVFGFGAHLNTRIAVLRAVTEMGQLLPHFGESRDKREEYAYDDPDAIHWWRNASVEQHPYLLPDSHQEAMNLRDYDQDFSNDFRDDVLQCVQIVRDHRMELLVLDQTRPDIRMPVVKVIVPGLRHFWARFAPGRLYDVPVRQGWLKKKKHESELNPIAIFV